MGGKPWFAHYDAGVPRTLEPYPPKTLVDYVANTALQWPAHPALLFKGRCMTYDELTRLSDAFATALLEQGVKPGDRVALLLPNCPQFVIAELGAWKAGAIVVPLNPLYSNEELHVLLADCGAETVVVLTPFAPRVHAIQPHTAVKRVIATRIQEYVPLLPRVAYTVTHAWHTGLVAAGLQIHAQPVRGQEKVGSVGLPLPDVELDIMDLDSGVRSLAPGEGGEVVLRAPQIMASYWQKSHATAEALQTRDAGGPWLYTGDVGYMDADGYLCLVDRKTDLIKTSGYQVWPWEIEDVIAMHPAVAEVGVAKRPDAVKGEVAKAWVVLRPGASMTAGDIRAYCHEHLAPYKVPAVVVLCRALPRTLLGGKILRRLLDDAPSGQHAVESDDARAIT